MKKIALVSGGVIQNIAVWDEVSSWNPPAVSLVDVTHSQSVIGASPVEAPSQPSVTDGLIWLDASDVSTMTLTGSRLDEWRDALGSGHKFVPSPGGNSFNPLYDETLFGNRGGVSFNNSFLESSEIFPLDWSGFTVLMVMKNKQRSGIYFVQAALQSLILGTFNGERVGSGNQGGTAKGIPRDETCLIGSMCSGQPSTWKYIIDNEIHTPIQGSAITSFTGPFPKVQIGGAYAFAGYGIYEAAGFLFYNRVLTEAQVVEVAAWIKDYYGVAEPTLPEWNIILDGNSLSWGLSGLNTSALYDGVLEANGSPSSKDIEIRGWTAQHTQALVSRGPSWIDSRINPNIPNNRRISILWEGTNDFSINNVTDIECYASIKAYGQARKLAGFKTIIATILPMKTPVNANFETYRLSVNQMIRDAKANGESWIDAVADIGGDALIGLQATTNNTTYYNDGTHLTDLGHSLAKVYVTEAVNLISGE